VSRKWLAAYSENLSILHNDRHIFCKHHRSCKALTSHVQAFTSVSRLLAAHAQGLQWLEPFPNPPDERYDDWGSTREKHLGQHCSLEALQQAEKLGMQFTPYMVLGAAKSHCLPKLQYLLKKAGQVKSDDIVGAAAEGADLDALRWLKAQGMKFDKTVPLNSYEHLHMLQYFLAEGCVVEPDDTCNNAACCGSLEVTKWAHSQGYAFPHDVIGFGAAMSGCLELVLRMHDELSVRWDAEDLSRMLMAAGLQRA
jgi:hypothetical protein